MPFVYILRCGDGSLYTGVARNPAKRLVQHRAGRASRYTRAHLPVEMVWMRRVRSWRVALKEEYRIKALRRTDKEALVNGTGHRAWGTGHRAQGTEYGQGAGAEGTVRREAGGVRRGGTRAGARSTGQRAQSTGQRAQSREQSG